ncbi:MAG: hypothetical protein V3W41_12765 [Planctomycetota bacterium]
MARRKKRILFDVMGTGRSSAPARKSPSGRLPAAKRSKASASGTKKSRRESADLDYGESRMRGLGFGEGEFRITVNLAAAMGMAFVVFMALSYYFGYVQGSRSESPGRGSANESSDPSLSKNRPASTFGTIYSVRANKTQFSSLTQWAMEEDMKAQANFLEKEGYEDVDLRLIEGAEDNNGPYYALWVGASQDRDSLDDLAEELRGLKYRKGEYPFYTAFVLPKFR